MFFVDQPYVSDFLKRTLRDHAIPVVDTPIVKQLDLYRETPLITETRARELAKDADYPLVYTTSEHAIGWLAQHPEFRHLSRTIELFKNKVLFRERTSALCPSFFFAEVRVDELAAFPAHTLPFPCIVKPAVGFFSMGVYKVTAESEWAGTVAAVLADIGRIASIFPTAVLDTQSFIVEQCITGEEFAIDAYFTSDGEPVILGIFSHLFSSEHDVSDRVYTSSKRIIERNLEEFTAFVGRIGKMTGVRNFPVHIELRREPDGTLLPIEVNPLRFGGWCTTADLSFAAYGLNPYLAYYRQQAPNWDELLKGKDGKVFSLVVLDNSTGLPPDRISEFHYDKVLSSFTRPLELRKVDYTAHPVFGFLFTETQEGNDAELYRILHSNLREFVVTQ